MLSEKEKEKKCYRLWFAENFRVKTPRSIDENKLELLIISNNYRIDESTTYNGELKR
jgi:hypothetical protein